MPHVSTISFLSSSGHGFTYARSDFHVRIFARRNHPFWAHSLFLSAICKLRFFPSSSWLNASSIRIFLPFSTFLRGLFRIMWIPFCVIHSYKNQSTNSAHLIQIKWSTAYPRKTLWLDFFACTLHREYYIPSSSTVHHVWNSCRGTIAIQAFVTGQDEEIN